MPIIGTARKSQQKSGKKNQYYSQIANYYKQKKHEPASLSSAVTVP